MKQVNHRKLIVFNVQKKNLLVVRKEIPKLPRVFAKEPTTIKPIPVRANLVLWVPIARHTMECQSWTYMQILDFGNLKTGQIFLSRALQHFPTVNLQLRRRFDVARAPWIAT